MPWLLFSPSSLELKFYILGLSEQLLLFPHIISQGLLPFVGLGTAVHS